MGNQTFLQIAVDDVVALGITRVPCAFIDSDSDRLYVCTCALSESKESFVARWVHNESFNEHH